MRTPLLFFGITMNDDELFKLYAGMAMQALITAAKVPWDLIPHLANEMAQKMIAEQGGS